MLANTQILHSVMLGTHCKKGSPAHELSDVIDNVLR